MVILSLKHIEDRLTTGTGCSGNPETRLSSCHYLLAIWPTANHFRPQFSLLKMGRLSPLCLPHRVTGRTRLISEWALKTIGHVIASCMCVCVCGVCPCVCAWGHSSFFSNNYFPELSWNIHPTFIVNLFHVYFMVFSHLTSSPPITLNV